MQDVDLVSFAKMVCSILDIPVYDNPIESMHVLFTLLLEFKNNPAFKASTGMNLEEPKYFSKPKYQNQSTNGQRKASRSTVSNGRLSTDVLTLS